MKDFVASHTGRRFFDNFGRLVDQLERLVNHLASRTTNSYTPTGGLMAIAKKHRINFDTLLAAAEAKDLCLLEVYNKQSGEPVTVICATYRNDKGDMNFVPLARMFEDNPYDAYTTEAPTSAEQPAPGELVNPFGQIIRGAQDE